MSMVTSEMTPADIAAVTGNNGMGFGGEGGAWWIIILFLFVFLGWGGRGFGGYGATDGGVQTNYVLTSDFAQVERKLDSITNGLCDGFYTQAQLINGVTGALATQGFETRNAITQAQIAEMNNSNTTQRQIADCCCANREAIAAVNYNMSMNTNAIQNSMNVNTRDILENNCANTRAILDALMSNKLEAKNDRIAELERKLTEANFAASQSAQTAQFVADNACQTQAIINKLSPCPSPAYIVPNPNCCYSSGCGCNA